MSTPSAWLVLVISSLHSLNLQWAWAASLPQPQDSQASEVLSRTDILNLHRSLAILDGELLDFQKRECLQNTRICELISMTYNGDYVESDVKEDTLSEVRMLRDSIEIREAILTLSGLLKAMSLPAEDTSEQRKSFRKRSCRLRLAGHCLTEQLDAAASQYWYLKSSKSPGKRRRRSLFTKAIAQ